MPTILDQIYYSKFVKKVKKKQMEKRMEKKAQQKKKTIVLGVVLPLLPLIYVDRSVPDTWLEALLLWLWGRKKEKHTETKGHRPEN